MLSIGLLITDMNENKNMKKYVTRRETLYKKRMKKNGEYIGVNSDCNWLHSFPFQLSSFLWLFIGNLVNATMISKTQVTVKVLWPIVFFIKQWMFGVDQTWKKNMLGVSFSLISYLELHYVDTLSNWYLHIDLMCKL